MRKILIILLVLGLVWTALWAFMAGAVATNFSQARVAREEAGIFIDETPKVSGFPGRLVATFPRTRLTPPLWDQHWEATGTKVTMAPLPRPSVSLELPPEQTVTMLDGRVIDIAVGKNLLSVSSALSSALTLEQIDVTAQDIAVNAPEPLLSLSGLDATLTKAEGTTYRLSAHVKGVGLAAPLRATFDPESRLAAQISPIRIEADLGFVAPINRHLVGGPVLETVAVETLLIDAGSVSVSGSGALAADQNGFAEGRLTLRITGWETFVALIGDVGLVEPGFLTSLTQMGEALSAGSDETPLIFTFANGIVRLGFIPLGPAPQFY